MDLTIFKDALNDALPPVLDFAIKHYKNIGSFGLFTDNKCNHLVVVANIGNTATSTCEYDLWVEDFIDNDLPEDIIDKLTILDKIFIEIFKVDGSDHDDFILSDSWLNTQKEVFEICVEFLADLKKRTDHDIIMGFDPFEYDENENIRFFNKMNPDKQHLSKHLSDYFEYLKE